MNGKNPIQWDEQHEVELDMNAIELIVVDTHYQNYLVVLVDDEGKEHVFSWSSATVRARKSVRRSPTG